MTKTHFQFILLISICLVGCQTDDKTPIENDGSKQQGSAASKLKDLENKSDGYLPVFDQDYPQNTITNRMAINFDRFANKLDSSNFIHWKSAGLKVYKPATMEISEQFTGFIDLEDGVAVLVSTNPFSMEQTTSQLVAENVRGGRSQILYTREIDVEGQKGVFYLTRINVGTNNYVTKRIISFGSDDFSWIVTATSTDKAEEKHGEEILKMMLNIHLAEEGPLANGDEVDFEITPNRLVLTNGFVDKLVFTLNGKFPAEARTKEPIFQIGKTMMNFEVADRQKLALQLITPIPLFQVNVVSSEKEVTIDGLDGYEFVAIARDVSLNVPLVMYSVVLFDKDGGYVMHGWFNSENEESFVPDFRGLAESFKRKSK